MWMFCLGLLSCLSVLLTGCRQEVSDGSNAAYQEETGMEYEGGSSTRELTAEIEPDRDLGETAEEISREEQKLLADFGLRIFGAFREEENVLVSPISMLAILGMTAEGAEGETLEGMELTLGMDRDHIQKVIPSYLQSLWNGRAGVIHLANSVWYKSGKDFHPDQRFLESAAGRYRGQIFQTSFSQEAVAEMNHWVSQHTDGRIDHILDSLPKETVMCLLNALSFEAEWLNVYDDQAVAAGQFVTESGSIQEISLMYSEEYRFLTDEDTLGFVKYYQDQQFAFVALLPKEGVDIEDYIASLDGKKWQHLWEHMEDRKVRAAIPKFTVSYDRECTELLGQMGMAHAFDPEHADFSGMGVSDQGRLYIDKILHKTFMQVDQLGTKAGAVTAQIMAATADLEEPEEVILNRPFVYAITDTETGVPIFIGAITDMEKISG